MLHIGAQTLQLVKRSVDHNLYDIKFFPHGWSSDRAFVALWLERGECFHTTFEVYNRGCQLVSSFSTTRESFDPCWALMPNDRVAIADLACFIVWDATSSQHWTTEADTVGLERIEPYQESSGQIAVNQSRLAFCPAAKLGQLHLYLYDVHTLQLLGHFGPEPGAAPLCRSACTSSGSALF